MLFEGLQFIDQIFHLLLSLLAQQFQQRAGDGQGLVVAGHVYLLHDYFLAEQQPFIEDILLQLKLTLLTDELSEVEDEHQEGLPDLCEILRGVVLEGNPKQTYLP